MQVRAAPGEVHGDGAQLFPAGVPPTGHGEQGRHGRRQRGARRRGLDRARSGGRWARADEDFSS